MTFGWPAFMGNGRADSVEKHLVTMRQHESDDPTRWLYVCGPDEAAHQVELLAAGTCTQVPVGEGRKKEFSHRFEWPDGVPAEAREMMRVLEEVKTLRRYKHVDCALVLDWYKVAEDDVEPWHWANTEAGELIHRGKYYGAGTARAAVRTGLVERLADVIQRHPLYAGAAALVTVPGSKGDGQSFGERMVEAVGKATGKPIIKTTSQGGHAPRKEGTQEDALDDWALPTAVEGDVVVLDDVISSGGSLTAVALAARRAGAERVFGLAAVKTMKG